MAGVCGGADRVSLRLKVSVLMQLCALAVRIPEPRTCPGVGKTKPVLTVMPLAAVSGLVVIATSFATNAGMSDHIQTKLIV